MHSANQGTPVNLIEFSVQLALEYFLQTIEKNFNNIWLRSNYIFDDIGRDGETKF